MESAQSRYMSEAVFKADTPQSNRFFLLNMAIFPLFQDMDEFRQKNYKILCPAGRIIKICNIFSATPFLLSPAVL